MAWMQPCRASEYMYWNKMYTQLEEAVKKCAPCNALKPPATRDMLKPTVQTNVHKSLEKRRKQNKTKVTMTNQQKTLSMLQPGDTVQMQTDRGYDKIVLIESRTNVPRSYLYCKM